MKKNIYAIYDKKSNTYAKYQWQDVNDDCAIRTVSQMVNDVRPTELSTDASDYELYRLGEIDLSTGIIESKVEFMKNCNELKRPEDRKKDEILKTLRSIFDEIAGGK